MKTKTIAEICFLWLLVFVVFQPIISHQDYMLDVAVKSNAEYAAQKAAQYGYVTAELRAEILSNLAQVGFNESEVTIESQNTEQIRGERIDVIIHAPRLPMFLYRFISTNLPTEYYAHKYTTSEYLP